MASTMEERLQRVQTSIDSLMARRRGICQTDLFEQAEAATSVAKEWLFAGVVAVLALLVVLIGGTDFITKVLGFAYPAYRSFQAIESKTMDDDKQWLTYWIVFGVWNLLEAHLIGPLLRSIPFYGFLKVLGFAWLYHSQTRGAEMLYELARPHVLALMQVELKYVPPKDAGDGGDAPKGDVLIAKVLSGRDLPAGHKDTETCSPYCVLKLLPQGGRKAVGLEGSAAYKTSTCFRTADPLWTGAQFVIPLERDDVTLDVAIMDKNNIGNDHYLGSVRVDISAIDGSFRDWVKLEDPDAMATWRSLDDGVKDVVGEVQLDLERKTM